MKNEEVKSLGFNISVAVPNSVEEFDTLAKREGACLENGVNNIIYRSTLATFRSVFCERLEQASGIQRLTETKPARKEGGDPITTFAESEMKFVARVRAEQGLDDESFKSSYSGLADEVIGLDECAFDPTKAERSAKEPKLAKVYAETATRIIDQGAGDKVLAKLGAKLNRELAFPEETGDAEVDKANQVKVLGAVIKEDQDNQRKTLDAQLMAD